MLPPFFALALALPSVDEARLVVQPRVAVRLELRTELQNEVSMGMSSAVMTTSLQQTAVITPKGEDAGQTRLYTVELGTVTGKVDMPSLGRAEFAPGKEQKKLDPMLATTVAILERLGGRTVTARVSPTGVVEDVEGDEDLYAGLVIPPELARMGMQVGEASLVGHVQNFFARLPDVPLAKGSTCFVDVSSDVRGSLVSFRPWCRITSLGKDKAGFEMKTDLEAFEKSKMPPAEKDAQLWTASNPAVKKATLHVTASVSLVDGLALSSSSTTTTTLDVPNPEGGTLPTVSRVRHDLARVASQKSGSKK